MAELTVDFIAFDDARDACLMVLVEEGPWADVVAQLQRLQDRVYGCMEAALDGGLAEQFPASRGRLIVIQVDCYGVPAEPVDDFIRRFGDGVRFLADYSPERSPFVRNFEFEAKHFPT